MTDGSAPGSGPGEILGRALKEGRLAHGLLLHGPSLVSLEELAYALVADILESERGKVVLHPDLSVVRPVNRMRQIGIDAIRNLVRVVGHSANQGGAKVGLVLEADRMNLAAANAFLKTLEEPPPGTILFLLSTRPNDLPDTILSRCLAFRVPGKADPVEDSGWSSWREDFREWLARTENTPKGKPDVAETVMRLYGLVQRFQGVLESITSARMSEMAEGLSEETAEEELAAIKAGVERGSRRDLLAGIESVLRDWALDSGDQLESPEDRSRKLILAVEAVEETAGLLNLNFNPLAAVEQLLIRILRVSSRH